MEWPNVTKYIPGEQKHESALEQIEYKVDLTVKKGFQEQPDDSCHFDCDRIWINSHDGRSFGIVCERRRGLTERRDKDAVTL